MLRVMRLVWTLALIGSLALGGCLATRQVAVSGAAGAACVKSCRARGGFADCVEECPGARESDCRPNGTTCVAIRRTTWVGTVAAVGAVVAVGLIVLYAAALSSLPGD